MMKSLFACFAILAMFFVGSQAIAADPCCRPCPCEKVCKCKPCKCRTVLKTCCCGHKTKTVTVVKQNDCCTTVRTRTVTH